MFDVVKEIVFNDSNNHITVVFELGRDTMELEKHHSEILKTRLCKTSLGRVLYRALSNTVSYSEKPHEVIDSGWYIAHINRTFCEIRLSPRRYNIFKKHYYIQASLKEV